MAAISTDVATAPSIQQEITDTVQEGAALHTDMHRAFDGCDNQ